MTQATPATRPGSGPTAIVELFAAVHLSPTQRRIARSILAGLPETAFLSSVQLAERAGVSQPSVTRFAVALGFARFSELQAALRRHVLAGPPGSAEAVRRHEEHRALVEEAANVRSLAATIDSAGLADLGHALALSTPLVVFGLRNSAFIAEQVGYLARRIHPDVRVVTSTDATAFDALLQARSVGATWLLGFVMPRYPTHAVESLRYARELGLRSAVITDGPLVPFAADVDVLLAAPVGRSLVFDSHAAPHVLGMLVLHAMADGIPQRTQQRLEAYERMVQGQHLFPP